MSPLTRPRKKCRRQNKIMEGLSPEQQAQQFKEEYERKIAGIQQAAESGESSPEIAPEHQAVSEVTEGIIQQQVPEFKASSHAPGRSADQLPDDMRTRIQEWINITVQDPYKGVKAASDSQDIALIDAFHGALTSDEIFPEIVKLGKLPEVK